MNIGYITDIDVRALLDYIMPKKEIAVDHERKQRARLKIERIIDSCKTGDQVRMTLDMIDMFHKKFGDSLAVADLRERMNLQTEKMCMVY